MISFDSDSIAIYTCIVLSLVGSSIMLTNLLFFDTNNSFAQRLVSCLSISDFIYAMALLLYVNPPNLGYDQNRCVLQGAGTQFAVFSAFIWSTSIAYFLYISIKGRKYMEYFEKYQNYFYIVGFGIPFITAIIPLFYSAYRPTPDNKPHTCSIKSDDTTLNPKDNFTLSLYLNLWLFYLPLGCAVILSCTFIIITWCTIRKQRSNVDLLNRQISIQMTFSRNLIAYPAILTICWLPSIIIFCVSALERERVEFGSAFEISQYGLSFLQGFFNSLAYYFNSRSLRRQIEKLTKNNQVGHKLTTETYISIKGGVSSESLRSSDSVRNSLDNFQDI